MSLGLYVLDESGEPRPEPDVATWAAWYEHADRTVALTRTANYAVSTVFLGMDHDFVGMRTVPDDVDTLLAYRPLAWETMIFGSTDPLGIDQVETRYRSREEAEEGHWAIVAGMEADLRARYHARSRRRAWGRAWALARSGRLWAALRGLWGSRRVLGPHRPSGGSPESAESAQVGVGGPPKGGV